MRALHVFPLFGDQLASGSDYHQFMLTRALVRAGIDVDVFTTCTARIEHRSAFGLGWPADYPAGGSIIDGVRVQRFPVSLSMPNAFGHALSGAIMRRWARETARDGPTDAASADDVLAAYHRQASHRPLPYDALAFLGRGPHSPRLLAAVRRAAPHYDVLLAGFSPFATLWYVTVLARAARRPVVLLPLFHPEDRYHHFRSLYWSYRHADALLAQTDYSTALFRRLLPGSNPVQVGPAVDPSDYGDERCDGRRFRARHGLTDHQIVLTVGRKEHHKRYDLVVDAIEQLADDRTVLIMIGADVDHQPIASRRVRWLGPLERAELLDAYDACDVFVLPSEYESFGLVFLEAWMRKKPVIGNATCRPVCSVIRAGHDGFLATTPAEFAAHIRTLLADPARARAMGEAGYAKVTGRYTWPHVAQIVGSVYAEVSAGHRRAAVAA